MHAFGGQSQNRYGAAIHLTQNDATVITDIEGFLMRRVKLHVAQGLGEGQELRAGVYAETLVLLKAE